VDAFSESDHSDSDNAEESGGASLVTRLEELSSVVDNVAALHEVSDSDRDDSQMDVDEEGRQLVKRKAFMQLMEVWMGLLQLDSGGFASAKALLGKSMSELSRQRKQLMHKTLFAMVESAAAYLLPADGVGLALSFKEYMAALGKERRGSRANKKEKAYATVQELVKTLVEKQSRYSTERRVALALAAAMPASERGRITAVRETEHSPLAVSRLSEDADCKSLASDMHARCNSVVERGPCEYNVHSTYEFLQRQKERRTKERERAHTTHLMFVLQI